VLWKGDFLFLLSLAFIKVALGSCKYAVNILHASSVEVMNDSSGKFVIGARKSVDLVIITHY
jgi:hypothetical protein